MRWCLINFSHVKTPIIKVDVWENLRKIVLLTEKWKKKEKMKRYEILFVIVYFIKTEK